jgi:ABC-2 type transport system ATP-binding protein
MASDAAAVSVRDLTKRFGRLVAVDRLSFEVPAGVVAGFIGPNGAGKSTTLAMLVGLIRPTAGSASVLGHDIGDPATYVCRVGALIEAPAFYRSLSGRQNLELVASVGGHDRGRIGAVLDVVGLADRADDHYRTYSMGMKQRLGIAAALLGDPELLLLDEPAGGLDPVGIAEMRALLKAVARDGRSVLVSSHALADLEQVCDWLVMIDRGACLYQGAADRLLAAGGCVSSPPLTPRTTWAACPKPWRPAAIGWRSTTITWSSRWRDPRRRALPPPSAATPLPRA